jgi:outer membrane protein insertion porin family
MKKIFLKSIIVYLLLTSFLFSEIIKDVDISGNKRISKETILVLGKIKKGENFNNDKLNNSLKKLYDTNFFSDVDVNLENNLLKIRVVENPIIEDIEITGIKKKSLVTNILDRLYLKDRMSYTEDLFKRDLILLDNILKTNGYYFADVSTSLIKNDNLNSVKILMDIDIGERAKIQKIEFIGDKKIKDKKLLEVITSEEHKFWKFISTKVYLNETIINFDKRLLENYYKNQGYYNIKVENSFAEYDKNGFFKLIFNVNAGERFYFNDLKIILPADYKKSDFVKIENIFSKLKGDIYSLDDFNLILKEIDKIASMKLYDFIDAKVETKITDNDKLDFKFNIIDSEKFYIEKINILGNFNTIEEVIRNRLIVDEGDPLNTLLFNKSVDNIKSLRIFKTVNTQIKDGSNPNFKIIDVIVEEKPTGEFSLAAGFGTSGGTIGGGIKEKNFLGKGIDLTANLEVSEDSVKGKFIYSKPNFAYTDNTLFTSFTSTTSDFLAQSGYKVSELGISIGTEFQQYENLYFKPEIAISIEDLETDSTASTNFKKQEGTYNDLYFNYGLTYDLRNSAYKPSSGYRTSFSQKLPIFADSNEIDNAFNYNLYNKFSQTSDMVVKSSLYLRAVNSLGGDDVRVSKRANVPYRKLRGFEKGKVGPVDRGDHIGGNYVTTLNLSANLPGILNTVENLDFTYFIDIANVWGVDYDNSIDSSNYFRSSTGIGIDFLTPIGPLNFSFTQPITKKSSDQTETFRFNIGTTF